MRKKFKIGMNKDTHLLALAGNPNTGKSTVFNYLTGLKQHTGNWPGKTVMNARGRFKHNDKNYTIVDVPGTYSLFATSEEEIVARDFICFGEAEVVIVVMDATALERNFNLLFQIMELTKQVILVINLLDEARRKNIQINKLGIEYALGIPVVLTAARSGVGMAELKDTIDLVINNEYEFQNMQILYSEKLENEISELEAELKNKISAKINQRWLALRILDGDYGFFESMKNFFSEIEYNLITELKEKRELTKSQREIREEINQANYQEAEKIKNKYVQEAGDKFVRDKKIDDIVTSKLFGIPLMIVLLFGLIFITIKGANYPSELLAKLLFSLEAPIRSFFNILRLPNWLLNLLVDGLYKTLAWVVSVMLPPMAIFFPLFTLLEDLGYLPRVCYNLDHLFKKSCAHGKQCLSMCMGIGCNAAGVIGTRIIESPREKLIAIITNNFIPCNGRFPTLIAIATIFFGYISYNHYNSLVAALLVAGAIIAGVIVTFIVSYLLSKTILKGVPSSFTLELPPYRKPKIGKIIYTSLIDRTIFVLGRAVVVAIPAGIITWLLANLQLKDQSILRYISDFLEPFARPLGLDGIILLAFILCLPANEILIPIILMSYLAQTSLTDFTSLESLREILLNNGWTYLTALNMLIFTLFHWPCSTTLLTIKKETGSIKWTLVSFIIPTLIGIILCLLTTVIYNSVF